MADGRELDRPAIYQIRIKGRLDPQWDDWFDGFIMEVQPDDETLLSGQVIDQAALYGILLKLHNLGLLLLSVQRKMGEEPLVLGHDPLSDDFAKE